MNFKLTISLLAVLTMSACITQHRSDASKAKATVMITNLEETSGGTGVVLRSTSTESSILTNSHVCGVVEHGGVIKNDNIKGFVSSYTRSEIHDLCLIKTSTNFKVDTSVAQIPPDDYSEAAVSGHPHLLPTLITKGNFGKKLIVTVMTGFRPCTPEDMKDPMGAFICTFLGGFPVVRTYESQVVGATIQAGNSGSAVYNENGEVAGLVFAGSGDLSYGLIVPQEYIYNFLFSELNNGTTVTNKPDTVMTFSKEEKTTRLRNSCEIIFRG